MQQEMEERKPCRFFSMPRGCAHGDSCSYVHEGRNAASNLNAKRIVPPAPMIRSRKILLSGLPSCVESGDVYRILEEAFGPVLDAIVIPAPSSDDSSEGIGVVTFKNVNSVFAAMQARHIEILGKKVTIEARSAFTGTKRNGNVETNPTSNGRKEPLKESPNKEPKEPLEPVPLQGTCLPAWTLKFKQWLPKFLAEAAQRTKGDVYPLCSLKGDFRATCGLELDHLSLGYEKLADFLRAMPEVVTLKTVPVGNGPAVHIVLERTPPGENEQVSSLIDAIREQQALSSSPLSFQAQQFNISPHGSPNGNHFNASPHGNIFNTSPHGNPSPHGSPLGNLFNTSPHGSPLGNLNPSPHGSPQSTSPLNGQRQVPMGYVNPADTTNMPLVPVFYVGNNMFAAAPGGLQGGLVPFNVPSGVRPSTPTQDDSEWSPFQNWQFSDQENVSPNVAPNVAPMIDLSTWEAFLKWQQANM